MKVAHVVRQYLPSVGGMEEVVRNLVLYQQGEGRYLPFVVTLNRVFREPAKALPLEEKLDGTAVRRLPYRGSERYPLCPQVVQALREADLVHVHGIDFFFDYLAWTRVLHGKPLLASTHGGFFHTEFAQRLKKLYFHTVTRASALAYRKVIATSDNDGAVFNAVVGAERLEVIENGVDIDKFADASAPGLQATLIYFGRWSVNKGLLESLNVFAALCALQPDTQWKLIVAGREYDLDGDAIRRHAERLGVAGNLQVVSGPTNAELRLMIAKSSYFICMSHHEGFGIAPIEAMSAGLVPILSAIPPFKSLVQSGGVGVLLDAGDANTKAQQIAGLHAGLSQVDRHATQRRAALVAASRYAWSGVGRRYTEQYDQAMRPR